MCACSLLYGVLMSVYYVIFAYHESGWDLDVSLFLLS